MEEIGKLLLIDGLLFALLGDERSRIYDEKFRDHRMKLRALDVFPLLLHAPARLDPRYDALPAYKMALVITTQGHQEDRKALAPWLVW